MRKRYFLLCAIVFSVLFTSCLKEDEEDQEKIVEMKIYPETGFGGSIMSEVWTEPLLFSDSEDSRQRMLVDISFEGLDLFDYERGYEYIIEVRKVWMQNPPQDASSVKYVFLEMLSKGKFFTEDFEEVIEVTVSDKTVKFAPRFPTEYEQMVAEDGENYEVPKVYDAMHLTKNGTDDLSPIIVRKIEGFDYEEGYEYSLSIKKKVQADPYAVEYSLLDIISKEKNS